MNRFARLMPLRAFGRLRHLRHRRPFHFHRHGFGQCARQRTHFLRARDETIAADDQPAMNARLRTAEALGQRGAGLGHEPLAGGGEPIG